MWGLAGGSGVAPTLPWEKSLHSFFFIELTRKALTASADAAALCSISCLARLRSVRKSSGGAERGAFQPHVSIVSCLTLQLPSLALLSQMSGGRKQHGRTPSL